MQVTVFRWRGRGVKGKVWHLNFLAFFGQILTLRSWDNNKNPVVGKRIIPEVPIPVVDQKDRGLWERDWNLFCSFSKVM